MRTNQVSAIETNLSFKFLSKLKVSEDAKRADRVIVVANTLIIPQAKKQGIFSLAQDYSTIRAGKTVSFAGRNKNEKRAIF